MRIAPMQDNNRLQHMNPRHPANVAHRVALARVKSSYSPKFVPHEMLPAAPGQIARAKEFNREHPNTTFFTPGQSRTASRMARHNNPLGSLGDRIERRVGLRGVGKELADSFNPTTRAGLVNALGMLAGGPKDDLVGSTNAEGLMREMGGKFRPYSHVTGSPLERGIAREGVGPGRGGAGIRGLARRAQGVGGYRRANPMDVIEGKHMERSKIRETSDAIKNYSNRQGFQNRNAGPAMRAAEGRTDNLMRLDEIMGSRSIPYSFRDAVKQENRQDRIPQTGEGLDNFVNYLAHYMDKGYDFHEGSMKAMHDYLFGGDLFRFPGSGPIPKKP